MKKEDKEALMNAVLKGTLKKVQYTFKKHKLVVNKSFFDNELLKAALVRKHCTIANFLMKKNCRVRNTKKNNSEKETAFHLAMKFDNKVIIKKMLNRGVSIYDKNHNGDIPIYAAFKEGYFSTVDGILDYCCNLKNLNPQDESDIIHFHIACIRNNLIAAKLYITSGFDVNSSLCVDAGKYFPRLSIYPGMTPLYFAVMEGFEELVQLLLENGADCNKADKEGNTLLQKLCKKVDTEENIIFKILLEYKANLQAVNEHGCTPLHLAFYYLDSNQKYIFNMLLSKEPWGPINFTNDEGLSYLHIACTTNNVNQVKKFLDTGLNIDSPVTSGMYSGYTALHFAVLYNQKEVVELLLKRGVQVNIKSNEKGVTPLHLACQYKCVKFYDDMTSNCQNQLHIIKLLLLYDANIESKDSSGKTPLFHAGIGLFDVDPCYSVDHIEKNHIIKEVIEILLYNNANVCTLTNNQSSLLHIFSENKFLMISEELIKLFVDKGLNVNAVNDAGLTPLHIAVKSSNTYMVKNLIKHKANVNVKSKDYTIPLDIFADKHSIALDEVEIIDFLLKYGSNINIVNKRFCAFSKGSTFLHYLIHFKKHPCIIQRLLYFGADINMKDSKGNSPLYYLIEWEYEDDVDWSKKECSRIFEWVFSHIQKLLALGLYVSEQVRELSTKIYQSYDTRYPFEQYNIFNRIFSKCNEEKQRMQHIEIDTDTSLYSILKKSPHELLKYIRNTNFVNIIENLDFNIDFPWCGHLLDVQYRRGLVRRHILESAKASLINVIGFHLPDLCQNLIIEYLTNEELDYLITAANMEDSFKRKFDDNQNQLELPIKMHKKE